MDRGFRNPDETPFVYMGPLISNIQEIYRRWKSKEVASISEDDYAALQAFHKAIGGTYWATKALHITEEEYEAFFPRP